MNSPIFITGIERSGSSIIAKALDTTGGVYFGARTGRYENKAITNAIQLYLISQQMDPYGQFPLPVSELDIIPDIQNVISNELIGMAKYPNENTVTWAVKSGLLLHTWKTWVTLYPNARWVFVRRRPEQVIRSCNKTEYMKAYEYKHVLEQIKAENVADGWRHWIRWGETQMVTIMRSGISYWEIWPDRFADGDYSQLSTLIDGLGLTWNQRIIPTISRLFLNI